MSFGNNESSKAPWVEVSVSGANKNGKTIDDETELLLNEQEDEMAAEAIPCVETEQMDRDATDVYPQAKVFASGTAGCVFGFLIGGVLCATAGGLGSAYAAKHKGGTCLGDTARAMGEVATLAHTKAVEVDQKYDVAKTTQETAKAAFKKAKAMDQQYNICEKSKNTIVYSGKATIDFAARHRLVERGAEAVGRGLGYVSTSITASTASISPVNTSANSESDQKC